MTIILISIAMSSPGSAWDPGLGAIQPSMAGERALEVKWSRKDKKIFIKVREQESGKAESLDHLHPLQSSVHLPYIAPVTMPYQPPFHLCWKPAEEQGGCCILHVPLLQTPLWDGCRTPPVLHTEPQLQMSHFAQSRVCCTP